MKPPKKLPIIMLMLVVMFGLLVGGTATASDSQQQVTFQAPLLVVNTSFLNVRTGPGVQYSVLVTVVGGTELPVLGVARDQVWYQVATDGGPGWLNVSFTLPRGDFSNVPVVEVGEIGAANADLGQGGGAIFQSVTGTGRVTGVALIGRNLRAQPSFVSLIISSMVPNDPNTIYPLLDVTTGDAGSTWYFVDVPELGRGWTDAVEFRLLACNNENVGVIIASTPIRFDGIANRDSFLLQPPTEGLMLGYTGTNNSFMRFELVDGTVGLVDVNAIAPRNRDVVSVCSSIPDVASLGQGGGADGGTRTTIPSMAGNYVVVNTGNLNLRSGPSAGFSVVASVPGGTELIVLGRATDNVWYLVEGEFGQGWLNSQFVLFRGNYSSVPVLRDPVIIGLNGLPISALGQGGGVVLDNGRAVNVNAVTSGRQVTGVSLIGRDMRAEANWDSMIINSLVPNDRNTIYPLLGTAQDSAGTIWYLVSAEGIGTGWMDGVELRVLECGADSVGIVINRTPIRFDGFANRDSFLLEVNTEGFIVGRRNDMAIFELVDGTTGLVNANDIAARPDAIVSVCDNLPGVATGATGTAATGTTGVATQPQASGNRIVINTGNLNVRSGPSAGFSVVATVPGGSELAVIGRAPDGVWYYVEGTFGRGWLNNQFVLFRGDYATVPVIDISGS